MALMKRGQRSSRPTFVVLLDLDGFKTINDQQGHIEGDEILRQTARILKQQLPTETILARIGGDEFAIIAVAMGHDVLLEQLRQLQSAMPCSFSFGIAPWMDSSTLDTTMAQADKALYVDKRNHQRRHQQTATEPQPD
jgi:diguanylate cyclase (GGDEF)-like protein